jgi:arylsulfatase A-like enzyme
VGAGATNTPLRGGKATTFEGGIRVPAVMRWPGRLKPGSVSRQVLTMMDYFPTLTAAAGLTPGSTLPLDGRNMWPSLTGEKAEAREDIFFAVETNMVRLAVRRREWKLVREEPRSGPPQNYLFRIDEDPTESHDLAEKNPKLVAELAAGIAAWRKFHPAGGAREIPQPEGYQAPKLWAEAARD